jgi:catechol 2,3-dioxygenase-like lactoylglutathione lyase family enzyme
MTGQAQHGPRVTGLGGIFYVVRDPQATRTWYPLISHFADDEYIKPGTGGFMINLRVDDLDGFVAGLRARGIAVLGEADEGYGKFAWLLDPDGVKIELWEQIDDTLP